MESWKVLAITFMASISVESPARQIDNPVERALSVVTLSPLLLIGGTTALISHIPELFKSAKSDALTFIGSDGEIRGASFEQAASYYHATYNPPLMTDKQLALAIATSVRTKALLAIIASAFLCSNECFRSPSRFNDGLARR